jgi:lambda repressor-like predicted transcriptional regulator
MAEDDPVLIVLDDLVAAGRENVVAWVGLMARADSIRELRRRGVAYKDMSFSDGISIIEAVSGNQERLTTAAARYRRAVARELHAEGMSPAAIAGAFGVSRQRIANLLAAHHAEPSAETDPQ